MIITLITIAVFALGIFGYILYERDIIPWEYEEYIELLSVCAVFIAGLAILIEIPLIICQHCTVNKDIYEHNLERESIVTMKMFQKQPSLRTHMTGIKKSITRNIGQRIRGRIGFGVRNWWILWNILNWITYIK